MAVCEPDRGFEDGIAAEEITAESRCSEFCIFAEQGVLEGDNAAERAAVKTGRAVKYRISESCLRLEYRAVEDNVGFKFHRNAVRLRPGPGKNGVLLKCAFVKDYRLG